MSQEYREAVIALHKIGDIVLPYPKYTCYTWEDLIEAVKKLKEVEWMYNNLN